MNGHRNGHRLPWDQTASEEAELVRSIQEHDTFLRSTIAPADQLHRELTAESSGSGTPPAQGTLAPIQPGVSAIVARWLRRSGS